MVKEQLRTAINDPELLEQQANEQLDGEYKEEAKKLEEHYKAELEKHPRFKGTKARTQARYAATVATQMAKRAGIAATELMNFAPTLVFTDADQAQAVNKVDSVAYAQAAPKQFGEIYTGYERKPQQALAKLRKEKSGACPGVFYFAPIGPIGIAYGKPGIGKQFKRGYGLAHIDAKHPGAADKIQQVLNNGRWILPEGEQKPDRVLIYDGTSLVTVDKFWNDDRTSGAWTVTSYVVTSKRKRKTLDDSPVLTTATDYRGPITPSPEREFGKSIPPEKPGNQDVYAQSGIGKIGNPTASIDAVRAKYQGTDQWLKAPNGEDTRLTEAQWCLVRTPEFKAWFGDWENDSANASKVVDKNGEPLVVYHGGQGRIEDFSRGTVRGHMGQAYFTDSIGAGASYAFLGGIDGTVETPDDAGHQWTHRSDKNIQAHPHITKAFLNIRNPITPNKIRLKDVVNMFGKELADLEENNVAFAKFDGDFDAAAEWLSDPSNLQEWLEESLTDEVASNAIENDFLSLVDEDGELQASQGFIALHLLGEIPQYMAAKGYDGFAYADNEAGGTTYVVQAPTQIKSASFNNGEFNPNETNIYRQDAAEPLTDPLVTIHNIRETGLLNIDKLGALPVPSLAVTKAGNEYDQYGEIFLIGTKGMVDSGRTPVFSADAYKARFYKRNRPVKSIRSPRVESGGYSTGLSGRYCHRIIIYDQVEPKR